MKVWDSGTWGRGWAALLCAITLGNLHLLQALPAAPVLYPASVAGPQVTLAWSAVPGATGYRLGIGPTPVGPEVYSQVVGPVNTVTFTSPLVGTAYMHVQAIDGTGVGPSSNVIAVTVVTLAPVPAAPVNLQAFLSGTTGILTWGAGPAGGAPLAVFIEAGTAPGAANLVATYLPLSTHLSVPGLPPGTYFVRVYAVNASGRSLPSNEVRLDVPVGGGCTAPPASALNINVAGSTVAFAWTPVGGVAGYRVEVGTGPAGPMLVSQALPASTTSVAYPGAPAGTFYARVVTVSPCGAESGSAVVPFSVAGGGPGPGPGPGPRTPNPPPGVALPLPNMSALVNRLANEYRGELNNSCVEHGGNNAWLFRLVRELRRYDTRWGLNWKRANVGDMSQDVVTYNYSNEPDEGTFWVYVVDVIGGHCGPSPGPFWLNHTTGPNMWSRGARWTLQPYIRAGGTP